MSQTYCIASGKGGVGKSTLTANLGTALAQAGRSVVIVDTDIGLRAQDALLGVENLVVYDILDVAGKDCRLEEALLRHPSLASLYLLPAAQIARAKDLNPSRLRRILAELKLRFDFILVDCPAGLERGLRNVLNAGTDQTLLILTPDDISIRDAERAVQLMDAKGLSRPSLIVNRLDSQMIYRHEMYSAQTIASLLDLPLLGEIPEDPVVYRAALRHRLLMEYNCEARRAVLRIASRLCGTDAPFPSYGSRKPSFFQKLFSKDMEEVTPLDRQ